MLKYLTYDQFIRDYISVYCLGLLHTHGPECAGNVIQE